ncbi:MAG TPA: amino acid permease, partial [Firmicutes bacterium]|nr:amino acid permease [Bacillota bacterium]
MNKRYGLMTAVTMIVGIVVGSGIFFKSTDILQKTEGNVTLAVLVFIIGAVSIVFGSLSMSELALRT